MAENVRSFPKIAESNWWKLRSLFKQRVPSIVTTTYLASALSMIEVSARSNIITPFKKLGILDEEGKPTDLAYDWRDDSKYPTVCQTLLETIYPQELRDLYSSLESDAKVLTSWRFKPLILESTPLILAITQNFKKQLKSFSIQRQYGLCVF